MLMPVFIILGTFGGVLSSRNVCRRPASVVCFSEADQLEKFPINEKELDQTCSVIRTTFECLQDYAEKCGLENVNVLQTSGGKLRNYAAIAMMICRKGTLLHSNVVRSLPCLKEIVEQGGQQCREYTRNAFNHLYEHVQRNSDENNNVIFDCLFPAIEANCLVTQTSNRCGSAAKDAVLEIMDMAEVLQECPAELRSKVLDLMEILSLITEEEVYVRGLLE
ncbi:uncharacterized protein CEXT_524191 [Caerostris extrusa]|uniref:Secreted protein n=1 Tax=Caerostris extrusa TaxID=172846 RepID=A0AAV4SLR5_CAEEX|nr:uncharacterized protein CEXT_524191 [Caerostris extrusa]